MQKIVSLRCPKCNNTHSFYRFGKDINGYQKYQCRNCKHQFAPDRPSTKVALNYPKCPVCGKSSFIHHDHKHYTNYRCCDKRCNHSFFVPKYNYIEPTSMSKLFGKTNFKRMRHPVYLIITALSMFYLGKNEELKNSDVAPVIENSRTLLPLRALSESLNFQVDWIDEERKVEIKEKPGNKRKLLSPEEWDAYLYQGISFL